MSMRRAIANVVMTGGGILCVALTGGWIYFFWGLDWGRGRHWNMMMVVFLFGTFAILILGLMLCMWLAEQIAPVTPD
jgi:preprotein translocase subunit SecY